VTAAVASPGSELDELLAEFERETAQARTHAPVRFEAPPRQSRGRSSGLSFLPPPPVNEPSFNDRVEPLLQPLRERVEQAEMSFAERRLQLDEEHRFRMEAAEAEIAKRKEALDVRDDVARALLSLRNVDTSPQKPAVGRISARRLFKMGDDEWQAVLDRAADGERFEIVPR
jgi:hypothetical protein